MEEIRKEYLFFGRVQGVGFRYRASHLALRRRISGFVTNEYDGSVRMEAQGKKEELTEFIKEISQGRWIEIDQIQEKDIPLEEGTGFYVR